MIDFAMARRMMVDGQVRTNAVTDPRLIAAMLEVPREDFVPAASAGLAYLDLDLPATAEGAEAARRMLTPMVLAKLIQALEIGEGDRILDVAGATGYAAALLSRLGASVVALEDRREFRAASGAPANIEWVYGSLAEGWAKGGPYDVILVEGSTEVRPQALLAQLREGGRLTVIEGAGRSGQAMLYRKSDGEVSGRPLFNAAAPLLPGFVKPAVFSF